MDNVNVVGGSLDKVLSEVLKESEAAVMFASKDAAKQAAQKTLKDLKALSPHDRGGYRKGWKVKNEGFAYIVYNSTYPGLTHLLENGHDIVVNGAKVGHKNGTPHISTAESLGVFEFEKLVVKEIERRLAK